jgi:hypothetical protein
MIRVSIEKYKGKPPSKKGKGWLVIAGICTVISLAISFAFLQYVLVLIFTIPIGLLSLLRYVYMN